MKGLWQRKTERAQGPIYSGYQARRDSVPERTCDMIRTDQTESKKCLHVIKTVDRQMYITLHLLERPMQSTGPQQRLFEYSRQRRRCRFRPYE